MISWIFFDQPGWLFFFDFLCFPVIFNDFPLFSVIFRDFLRFSVLQTQDRLKILVRIENHHRRRVAGSRGPQGSGDIPPKILPRMSLRHHLVQSEGHHHQAHSQQVPVRGGHAAKENEEGESTYHCELCGSMSEGIWLPDLSLNGYGETTILYIQK